MEAQNNRELRFKNTNNNDKHLAFKYSLWEELDELIKQQLGRTNPAPQWRPWLDIWLCNSHLCVTSFPKKAGNYLISKGGGFSLLTNMLEKWPWTHLHQLFVSSSPFSCNNDNNNERPYHGEKEPTKLFMPSSNQIQVNLFRPADVCSHSAAVNI